MAQRKSSIFGPLARAASWWVDGLADLVTHLAGGARRKRLRLVATGERDYRLEGPGLRAPAELQLAGAPGAAAFAPSPGLRALQGQGVDLAVPAETVLVRALDPLPPESRGYLDGIVRHQVDRLLPWRPTDVLYSYSAEPAGPGDPRLAVTIVATARSLHAAVLSALQAAGARSIRIVAPGAGGAALAIAVDSDAAEVAQRRSIRRAIGYGLAALALLAVAGGSVLAYRLDAASTELQAVQDGIAERRRVLVAAAGANAASSRSEIEAMIARKRAVPAAVTAIEQLSAVLPDDTFVTELRLGEGRVRLVGVTRSVAGLVPLVEASPAFADAAFFAPTTRLPGGQGDRFHVEARWLPYGEVRP